MQIETDVLDVLATQLTYADDRVVIQGALDRKLYVRVDRVLQACGGAWNRKAKAHLFKADPSQLIALAISTGEVVTDRDLGFFETPAPVARELVKLAKIPHGACVLEPSAGLGALIDAAFDFATQQGDYFLSVTAVEYDGDRAQALHTLVNANVHHMDFMDFESEEPFDCVVMNPPFTKVGKGDHLDHVVHASEMLISGGVLAAILPSSIEFRQDKRHREFREVLAEHKGEIIRLPERSFAPATNVNTVMIRMVQS